MIKYQRLNKYTHKGRCPLCFSLGTVSFSKTLFTNKETEKSEHLLGRIMGIEAHERITEDAQANMLKKAVQTSYRRGGNNCQIAKLVYLIKMGLPENYAHMAAKKAYCKEKKHF